MALVMRALPGSLPPAAAAQAPLTHETRTMDRHLLAEHNRQRLLGDAPSALAATDPDLAAMRDKLLYGEIAERGTLDQRLRALVTLAALTATQALHEIKEQTEAALRLGVSPMDIRETLYQCAPYTGFPKVESAVRLVNEVFAAHGIPLPLKSQATVTEATRFKDGLAAQKAIFGKAIDQMHAAAPEGQQDIMVRYLSAFCFGDIYTRKSLDLKTRELLTFSILSAMGGCDAQVKAHAQGNIQVGNSKQNLIDALAQLLPYIGFPRTLNALGCVNAVIQDS